MAEPLEVSVDYLIGKTKMELDKIPCEGLKIFLPYPRKTKTLCST
jgi:hypothetical protein